MNPALDLGFDDLTQLLKTSQIPAVTHFPSGQCLAPGPHIPCFAPDRLWTRCIPEQFQARACFSWLQLLKFEIWKFTNVFPSSAKVVVFEVVRTAESQKFQKQQGSCFISLVRKTSQQYSKQRQTVPASDSVPAVTTIVVSRYIFRINSDLSRRGTEARLLRRLPTCWRGPQICNVWE